MRLLSSILCVFVWFSSGITLQAQQAPPVERLLQRWLIPQAERARSLIRLDMSESARWSIDGPFSVEDVQVDARLAAGPAVNGWQREILSVTARGRQIEPSRWEQLERQRAALTGRGTNVVTRGIFQLPRMLRQMQPVGQVMPDDIDGVPCWRIDLVPRAERWPFDRMTLWLAQDVPHLLRSRLLTKHTDASLPAVITVSYSHIDGLDLPRHLHAEGSTQRKRRMRTFTMLFEYDAIFSDYSFTFQETE